MKNTNDDLRKTDIRRDEREERLERLKNRDGSKRKIRTGVHPAKVVLTLFLLAAIALGLIVLMLYNNGWREVNMTAGMVGDQKVSPLEANFYNGMRFQSIIPAGAFTANGKQALVNAYPGAMGLQMMRDTLLEMFRSEIVDVKVMSKLAREAGTQLTQEDQDSLKNFEAQVRESAASSQVTETDLLQKLYGPGASMKTIRPLIEQMLLINRFQKEKVDSMEVSEEELETYAEENADDLDLVDMRLFAINAATPSPEKTEESAEESKTAESSAEAAEQAAEVTGEETTAAESAAEAGTAETSAAESTGAESSEASETKAEEEKATEEDEGARLLQEARDKAQAMLEKVTDEESFKKQAMEYAADDSERKNIEETDSTLNQGVKKSNTSPDLGDWLFDKARKAGDKTVIDSQGGSAVVYFISRYRNEKPTFNSRHILVKLKEDEGSDLEKAKADAKAEAERILKEYQDGEQNEEAFAALAQQYSEDPGSKDKGGLYENVMPGAFVKPYENWVLENGRKEGDVGIVYVESSNYKGYHIIYFKNIGEASWKLEAEAKVKVEAFRKWLDEQKAGLSFEENAGGMKLVLPVEERALNSAKESIAEVMKQFQAADEVEQQEESVSEEASAESETAAAESESTAKP